ncbi:vacuolar protein sorting family 37 protein [Aspergillus lucknowensis]|uniref:VPS37 C-terminal domain-containing protein n=1 Tax=Aspergillus lucknowensis TaxID=176173 RepID=A0ABR4M6A7_9EURO
MAEKFPIEIWVALIYTSHVPVLAPRITASPSISLSGIRPRPTDSITISLITFIMNPALNVDTPPPPPPKPGSHEASRGGTPQVNSPSPGVPQLFQHGQYGSDAQNQHVNQNHTSNPENTVSRPPTAEENWLPEGMKEKSTVDLQTVLQTPSLISALSSTHPSYAASQNNLHTLLKYNQDLAHHLLDLQSRLVELRSSTETLLLQHQSLEVSWRKRQADMDAALAPWSPKALYQRLSAAIAEQEAVCQAVEESFLEGEHHGKATERDVAEWVRRVRGEGAKLAGRKEAKARWDEGRVGGWR